MSVLLCVCGGKGSISTSKLATIKMQTNKQKKPSVTTSEIVRVIAKQKQRGKTFCKFVLTFKTFFLSPILHNLYASLSLSTVRDQT